MQRIMTLPVPTSILYKILYAYALVLDGLKCERKGDTLHIYEVK